MQNIDIDDAKLIEILEGIADDFEEKTFPKTKQAALEIADFCGINWQNHTNDCLTAIDAVRVLRVSHAAGSEPLERVAYAALRYAATSIHERIHGKDKGIRIRDVEAVLEILGRRAVQL